MIRSVIYKTDIPSAYYNLVASSGMPTFPRVFWIYSAMISSLLLTWHPEWSLSEDRKFYLGPLWSLKGLKVCKLV